MSLTTWSIQRLRWINGVINGRLHPHWQSLDRMAPSLAQHSATPTKSCQWSSQGSPALTNSQQLKRLKQSLSFHLFLNREANENGPALCETPLMEPPLDGSTDRVDSPPSQLVQPPVDDSAPPAEAPATPVDGSANPLPAPTTDGAKDGKCLILSSST